MTAVLSTTSMPDARNALYWDSDLSDEFTAVAVTPCRPSLFLPRISVHDMGGLKVASVAVEACRLYRTAAWVANAPDMPVRVNLQVSGVGLLSLDGRQALVGEGELVICDSTRSYSMEYPEGFSSHIFSLPRRALSVTDAELLRVMGTAIRPSGGVAAMLAPLLTGLAVSASSYADTVAEQLAGNVTDMLATLIAEAADDTAPARHNPQGHLALRVRQFINHHLGDPQLTPETIAGAHHISVRYLHRIFEDQGTTVSRLVQQRRLEECRRELARRTPVSPTVSAVAHRWGFTNAAYFSRAFRTAYGVSPTEWREARMEAPEQPLLTPTGASGPRT